MAKIKVTLTRKYDEKVFEFTERDDATWRLDATGNRRTLIVETDTNCLKIPVSHIKSITFEEDENVSVRS